MKKGLLSLIIFLFINSILAAQVHFSTVWTGNGVDHMNFYVTKATIENQNMQAGDEIAVFDGSYCVGTGVLTEEIIEGSNFLSFVASKNDATPPEINGYTPGNEIILKLWDDREQVEIPNIETTYLAGEAIFSIGGTSSLKLNGILTGNVPIADAGADLTVNEGDDVELNGGESSDPLNANLTFSWTTNSGIILSEALTPTPGFIAPEVVEDTLFEFCLIVNNGDFDSEEDTVIINVLNVNKIPVITGQSSISTDEEVPITIEVNDLIIDDPDNVYPDDFSLTIGQGDNYSVLDNELTPVLDFYGTLMVPVTVSDGIDDSEPFTINIIVNNINDSPLFTRFPSDTTIDRNSATLFKIDANDADSEDSLYFTVSFNPGISEHNLIIVDLGKAELTITPGDLDESPVDVTITLTDSIISVPIEHIFRLNLNPTGIQYPEGINSLTIFPNPAGDKLFINTEIVSGEVSIDILSINGVKILSTTYDPAIAVNIKHIPQGIYIIRLRMDQQVSIKRFVKL